ncbi:1,4-alpha-glucan branching protein [soil metagenome]
MSESAGDLAVVLHSHMPYVEGFGTYPFGEEWLFDGVLRSYLPVLDVAEKLTMTVTPVLADQLEAPGLGERLRTFASEFRLGSCLLDAEEVEPGLRGAILAEAERYRRGIDRLDELGGDPLSAFSRAADERGIALMTSSATHAVLPMLATEAGLRLQIDAGLRSHRRRFGEPAGFWLPECAYEPGLEAVLAERGLGAFCVDQSRHEPPEAAMRPIATESGPVAFPIDWEAVSWLWSFDGYPSDPLYTDFHRESLRGARPWAISGEPRDPQAAEARAREPAAEFVAAISARLAEHRERTGSRGLIVFAIDTELLGHWWWEGPQWLAEVIRIAEGTGVRMVTIAQALADHEPEPRPIKRSSWGEDKNLRTWDSPAVADMAWGSRRLELRLLRELGSHRLDQAAAMRAARELLAVQASDWAFLDKRGQAGDYPFQRVTDHARELFEAIDCGERADPNLRNLAPDLSLSPLLET